MKLLFAPIGDPKNYDEVTYTIDSKSFKTNASFMAIEQALNLDKTIVYAGLSLCDISKYKDYTSCSNDISTFVKNKLQLNNETVIVAPNIYGNKFIQIDRKNTLYFNFIYYNTLNILNREKPDEIYIDVTHGINYMPLLATDAIKLATYTYIIEKNTIDLTIFNSEPIMPRNPGPYNIDKVFTEKLNVRQALLSVLMPFLSKENKNNITNKVLKEIMNCDTDLIYSNANALFSGIFAFLILSRKEIEECVKSIEQKIGILDYNNFKVNIEISDSLVYKDKMPIELSYLHSLLTIIGKIISNLPDDSCVKINDIKKLAKKFSISETISSLVLSEIDSINKKKNINENPQLLADIEAQCKHNERSEEKLATMESKKSICQPNERNLFAHGGFEQNVTYLWKKNEQICMSYLECKQNVKDHLK